MKNEISISAMTFSIAHFQVTPTLDNNSLKLKIALADPQNQQLVLTALKSDSAYLEFSIDAIERPSASQ